MPLPVLLVLLLAGPNSAPAATNCGTAWNLYGSAVITGTVPYTTVQLTNATGNLTAAAWAPACVDLTQNFDYQYTVYLGNQDGAGADGIAFVLQTESPNVLGDPGGALGIVGVAPSVAVELDTYDNGAGACDVAYDHLAVDINGVTCTGPGPVQASATAPNIEDGAEHQFEVVWNAPSKTMTVYFDGVPRLTYTNDIVHNVFSDATCAWWGFTGTTGMYSNLQYFIDRSCVGTRTPTTTFTNTPNWTATVTPTPTNTPNGCKVSPVSTITTFSGTSGGYSGDNGPASSAQLNQPHAVAVDPFGNMYIADTMNSVIRKVSPSGVITLLAGSPGVGGNTGDGGLAINATMTYPFALATDTAGDLFFLDGGGFGAYVVRKISPSGIITKVAGNGAWGVYSGDGGPATDAGFNCPAGMTIDSVASTMYIADTGNSAIRKVNLVTGIVSTVAGGIGNGFNGDGGQATATKLNNPNSLHLDASGNLFIADTSNCRVRKLNTATGVITTVAGNGTCGTGGDGGQASLTSIMGPNGVVEDSYGNLFIATSDARVRMVNLATGIIGTLAGTSNGFGGDGGPASAAKISNPWNMAFDALGNLYVSDTGNNRIRKISTDCVTLPTPTPTLTITSTSTPTPTWTCTSTNTPTATATRTNTPKSSPTPSVTMTDTSTASPTPTATPSATPTPTFLPSATPTATATTTPTRTQTPSATPSSSPTASPTPSATYTATLTASPTRTITSTGTPSASFTPSASVTATPSASPTVTATRTATPTPSVSPVFTLTATPTASPTPTATPTATFSASVTLSATATGSASASPTSTSTATATLTATGTASASPTRTATLSFTASPSYSQTWTFSPTPIPQPVLLKVTVYNSAGEVVKSLYQGPSTMALREIVLSSSTLAAGQASVEIVLPGTLPSGATRLAWDGLNDNGQAVQSGTYYFKVDNTDPFGRTISIIHEIPVVRAVADKRLAIYNSAGEIVGRIPLDAYAAPIVDFSFGSPSFSPAFDPATGRSLDPLEITLKDANGMTHTSWWDGRNGQGQSLASGSYTFSLLDLENGSKVMVTREVVLVEGAFAALPDALVAPNPVTAGMGEIFVEYKPALGNNAKAGLYNLAGELVGAGKALNSGGTLSLDASKLAPGVYMVVFEMTSEAGAVKRKTLKVAVVR